MSKKCMLCKFPDDDELRYGELLKRGGRVVHTFCLYLSSNLPQRGEDDEEFLGFLLSDIRKEQQRVQYLACYYCHRGYANIGCCAPKCRRTFHLICGIKNGAKNRFVGSHQSFCHQHVTKERYRPDSEDLCCICYDRVQRPGERFSHTMMLRAPCCANGWFHKYCLQHFANSSGYFFKCPLCNDTETFLHRMRQSGIFIPQRDAAWELEPHAFEELTERPSTCAATVCLNKNGRNESGRGNPIVLCMSCGSVAMHELCLPKDCETFACNECKATIGDDSGLGKLIDDAEDHETVCAATEADKFQGLAAKRKYEGSDGKSSPQPAKKNMPKCSSMEDSSDNESIEVRTNQGGKRLVPSITSSDETNHDEVDTNLESSSLNCEELEISCIAARTRHSLTRQAEEAAKKTRSRPTRQARAAVGTTTAGQRYRRNMKEHEKEVEKEDKAQDDSAKVSKERQQSNKQSAGSETSASGSFETAASTSLPTSSIYKRETSHSTSGSRIVSRRKTVHHSSPTERSVAHSEDETVSCKSFATALTRLSDNSSSSSSSSASDTSIIYLNTSSEESTVEHLDKQFAAGNTDGSAQKVVSHRPKSCGDGSSTDYLDKQPIRGSASGASGSNGKVGSHRERSGCELKSDDSSTSSSSDPFVIARNSFIATRTRRQSLFQSTSSDASALEHFDKQPVRGTTDGSAQKVVCQRLKSCANGSSTDYLDSRIGSNRKKSTCQLKSDDSSSSSSSNTPKSFIAARTRRKSIFLSTSSDKQPVAGSTVGSAHKLVCQLPKSSGDGKQPIIETGRGKVASDRKKSGCELKSDDSSSSSDTPIITTRAQRKSVFQNTSTMATALEHLGKQSANETTHGSAGKVASQRPKSSCSSKDFMDKHRGTSTGSSVKVGSDRQRSVCELKSDDSSSSSNTPIIAKNSFIALHTRRRSLFQSTSSEESATEYLDKQSANETTHGSAGKVASQRPKSSCDGSSKDFMDKHRGTSTGSSVKVGSDRQRSVCELKSDDGSCSDTPIVTKNSFIALRTRRRSLFQSTPSEESALEYNDKLPVPGTTGGSAHKVVSQRQKSCGDSSSTDYHDKQPICGTASGSAGKFGSNREKSGGQLKADDSSSSSLSNTPLSFIAARTRRRSIFLSTSSEESATEYLDKQPVPGTTGGSAHKVVSQRPKSSADGSSTDFLDKQSDRGTASRQKRACRDKSNAGSTSSSLDSAILTRNFVLAPSTRRKSLFQSTSSEESASQNLDNQPIRGTTHGSAHKGIVQAPNSSSNGSAEDDVDKQSGSGSSRTSSFHRRRSVYQHSPHDCTSSQISNSQNNAEKSFIAARTRRKSAYYSTSAGSSFSDCVDRPVAKVFERPSPTLRASPSKKSKITVDRVIEITTQQSNWITQRRRRKSAYYSSPEACGHTVADAGCPSKPSSTQKPTALSTTTDSSSERRLEKAAVSRSKPNSEETPKKATRTSSKSSSSACYAASPAKKGLNIGNISSSAENPTKKSVDSESNKNHSAKYHVKIRAIGARDKPSSRTERASQQPSDSSSEISFSNESSSTKSSSTKSSSNESSSTKSSSTGNSSNGSSYIESSSTESSNIESSSNESSSMKSSSVGSSSTERSNIESSSNESSSMKSSSVGSSSTKSCSSGIFSAERFSSASSSTKSSNNGTFRIESSNNGTSRTESSSTKSCSKESSSTKTCSSRIFGAERTSAETSTTKSSTTSSSRFESSSTASFLKSGSSKNCSAVSKAKHSSTSVSSSDESLLKNITDARGPKNCNVVPSDKTGSSADGLLKKVTHSSSNIHRNAEGSSKDSNACRSKENSTKSNMKSSTECPTKHMTEPGSSTSSSALNEPRSNSKSSAVCPTRQGTHSSSKMSSSDAFHSKETTNASKNKVTESVGKSLKKFDLNIKCLKEVPPKAMPTSRINESQPKTHKDNYKENQSAACNIEETIEHRVKRPKETLNGVPKKLKLQNRDSGYDILTVQAQRAERAVVGKTTSSHTAKSIASATSRTNECPTEQASNSSSNMGTTSNSQARKANYKQHRASAADSTDEATEMLSKGSRNVRKKLRTVEPLEVDVEPSQSRAYCDTNNRSPRRASKRNPPKPKTRPQRSVESRTRQYHPYMTQMFATSTAAILQQQLTAKPLFAPFVSLNRSFIRRSDRQLSAYSLLLREVYMRTMRLA